MRKRTILMPMAAMIALVATSFAADDPFLGTWKLNEAKSKIAKGAPKNHTIVYEAAGDNTKITVDGTAGDGSAIHSEWTGKMDGKEYPVSGAATADARSYKKVNNRTLAFTEKKAGKVVTSGRSALSADGKSRTVTMTTTDSSGKKLRSTVVYDKQ